ncbi:MAG: hypothetical protein HY606_09820 [Planctomycetes bacterium]|nr:hypothetical protein [Planctomycetota bacterium]
MAALIALTVSTISCDNGDEFKTYSIPKDKTEKTATKPIANISWKKPEGWKERGAEGLRIATFNAEGIQVTIIPLEIEASDIESNVNRWRDQVGLAQATLQEIESAKKEIEVDGTKGSYFDIDGTKGERILAVMVKHGTKSWFFKMTGKTEAIGREKTNFETLVKSVKFNE